MSEFEPRLPEVTKPISLREADLKASELLVDPATDKSSLAKGTNLDRSPCLTKPENIRCRSGLLEKTSHWEPFAQAYPKADRQRRDATESAAMADKIADAEIRDWVGMTHAEINYSLDFARSINADMEKVILA